VDPQDRFYNEILDKLYQKDKKKRRTKTKTKINKKYIIDDNKTPG
jgi:hypothetical protein